MLSTSTCVRLVLSIWIGLSSRPNCPRWSEVIIGALAEREAEVALAEAVNPETAYREAIGLAHEEDVSAWGASISARLEEWGEPVSLLELQESIQMPLV
jgi:hypothetical protein